MVEIISIRFKNGGKEYYFNPNGLQFQVGDGVIVETARGTEYAQCIRANTMVDEIELTAPPAPGGAQGHAGGRQGGGKKQGARSAGHVHLPAENCRT